MSDIVTNNEQGAERERFVGSTQMKELYTALVSAQSEFEDVHKDASNAHLKFNYASYSNIIKTTRPILKKYGLAVIQMLDEKDGHQFLVTRLCHISGQAVDSWVKIVPDQRILSAIQQKLPAEEKAALEKPGLKEFGGALTYLKRYSYATLLCLATTDEDPDSMQSEDIVEKDEYISEKQLGLLKFKLKTALPSFEQELVKKFGSLDKVAWKDFNAILTWIDGGKTA
jgi:hypothetical protein